MYRKTCFNDHKKNLENNDDKMSKWVIYISIVIFMCDIHISVDFNINMLFHILNRYTKQQNMQILMHKSIEYVKILKLGKFLGSCYSYITFNMILSNKIITQNYV